MRGAEGDLGFSAAGALLLLLLGAVIGALAAARLRWRLAAAQRDEVGRLAAWEGAEAEMMAVATHGPVYEFSHGYDYNYGSATGASKINCAVCFSPTTRRCSRCKAVKYCSGKCQIIHWRQGHKDVCRPPGAGDPCNGEGSVSELKGVQTERPDLHPSSLEIEEQLHEKPVEHSEKPSSEPNISCNVVAADDNLETKASVDTSGTEGTVDPFTASSLSLSSAYSVVSDLKKTSDDASANEDLAPLHNARISSDSPKKTINTIEKDTAIAPSEFPSDHLSKNGIYSMSSLGQKTSSCETKDAKIVSNSLSGSSFSTNGANAKPLEDTAQCVEAILDPSVAQRIGEVNTSESKVYQEGNCIPFDATSLSNPSNLPGQCIPSHTNSRGENPSNRAALSEGRAHSDGRIIGDLGFVKSVSTSSGGKDDVSSLKSEGMKCLSSIAPANHVSSTGVHLISHNTCLNANNTPALANNSDSRRSLPNGVSSCKTSVRRVMQQFKCSNYSRQYPSEFGNDMSAKYKMLFPYDLFIKLYNCDKVELRPFGLENCGNSCYANVVLQCLAFTRPLTVYLLQGLHTKNCPKGAWCFTCELESLLVKGKEGKSPLSAIGILSHIDSIGSNLDRGREEDAHEFLRYAIDAMQSVCLKEAGANIAGLLAKETTLVQLIFGGYLRSKIKCMKCRGKSVRNERMLDLSVEIHGDIGTLEEALKRFTTYELLDGDNKYKCDRCKSYERAKKKLTVLEAPNVLTIALKRFQSGKFGKLNKAVQFPEYLNLAPYMSGTDDKSPVYRLYAVVVHRDIMNAAFSGHYICYVNCLKGKWYEFDDSKVRPVELDEVLGKTAYLLFYARCSPRGPSLLRKAMSLGQIRARKSWGKDVIHSGHSEGSNMILRPHSVVTHQSFGPSDLFDAMFIPPKGDAASSDNSSLFSGSDEGSYSTDSTRDSTNTEFSENITGDSGQSNWNLRFLEDSDGYSYSPLSSSHSSEAVLNGHACDLSYEADHTVVDGTGDRPPPGSNEVVFDGEGPAFLYLDATNHQYRESLTEQGRSRQTDRVNNLFDVKSGLLMRRSIRERTGLTFY